MEQHDRKHSWNLLKHFCKRSKAPRHHQNEHQTYILLVAAKIRQPFKSLSFLSIYITIWNHTKEISKSSFLVWYPFIKGVLVYIELMPASRCWSITDRVMVNKIGHWTIRSGLPRWQVKTVLTMMLSVAVLASWHENVFRITVTS